MLKMFFIFYIIPTIAIMVFLNLRNKKERTCANEALLLIARLLQAEVKKNIFEHNKVELLYKGRLITVKNLSSSKLQQISFYITPNNIVKNKRFIIISYPEPTENTTLADRDISCPLYWSFFNEVSFDMVRIEQEIISILDELVKAAQIVETSALYYRE